MCHRQTCVLSERRISSQWSASSCALEFAPKLIQPIISFFLPAIPKAVDYSKVDWNQQTFSRKYWNQKRHLRELRKRDLEKEGLFVNRIWLCFSYRRFRPRYFLQKKKKNWEKRFLFLVQTLQFPSSNVRVTNVSGAFCVVRFRKCDPFKSSTESRPTIKILDCNSAH